MYGLHLLVMFMCSSCCFHVCLCLLVVFLYFLVVWFFVMFDFCLLFIIVILSTTHEIQIKAKIEGKKIFKYDMFISLFVFFVYWKKKNVCWLESLFPKISLKSVHHSIARNIVLTTFVKSHCQIDPTCPCVFWSPHQELCE